MSDRQSKWREVGKTAARLNSMLAPKSELPTRFAPSRDRSDSVDKLFNSSRSRLHSSMEMAALNSSRDDTPLAHREDPDKRDQSTERKTSVLKGTVLPPLLINRQSTQLFEAPRNSQLVADIKKEFWAFRQNVLQELERQKEMVQRLLKEIVLTLEFELEKQGRLRQEIPDGPTPPTATQVRSIEQWKNTLASVTLSQPQPRATISLPALPPISSVPPLTSMGSRVGLVEGIEAPRKAADVGALLGGIDSLKRQFEQMGRILSDKWEGEVESKLRPAPSPAKRK